MINGTNGKDDIAQFLSEHVGVVVEGEGPGTGAVQVVALFHIAAAETEIQSMAPGRGAAWGDVDKMADVFDAVATRHARGIVGGGAQQFTLVVVRSGGKPCAVFPFIRVGAQAIQGMGVGGVSGGGSLATEPPNAMGAMAMAMRLLETHAQGNFGLTTALATTMRTLVDSLTARLDSTEKRSDERWLALQNLLLEWQKQSMNSQMRALAVEAARKLLPLVPAGLATLTGAELPQNVVEDSLVDTLVENYPPERLQEMLGSMAAASPDSGPFVGVLADHLVRAQRRKAARDAETKRLLNDPTLPTVAVAEADAAGAAYNALRGQQDRPAPAAKRLMEAAQKAPSGGPKPEAPPSGDAEGADAAIVEQLLRKTDPAQIRMLAPMLGQELVDKIMQRYEELHAEGKV